MDREALGSLLKSTVTTFEVGARRVRVRHGRPVNLHAELPALLSADELAALREEDVDLADEQWPGSVQALIVEACPMECAIEFEWDSFGPMCWTAFLQLYDVGDGSSAVVFLQEEQPFRVIARLVPARDPRALAACFESLLEENGEAYGLEVMNSLPTRVTVGPLLDREVVGKALIGWLDWATATGDGEAWADFEETVLGQLLDSDPRRRAMAALEALPSPEDPAAMERWRERRAAAAADLGPADRKRLMKLYLES